MPASQLTQLKAALSNSGLNRKSHSKQDKKTFKKGGARETDRAKTLAKLEDIRKGLNKFDERETRVKHDVGGRFLKGVTGKPTAAKSAGLESRKKSLLPEHQNRFHRGTFSDRRFGESDPSMSLEDRMLERYTRERQRGQGRKGMFNLEGEEGDDDPFGMMDDAAAQGGLLGGGLTHGGRSVLDLPGDDFEAQGFGEYDEEEKSGKGAIPRRDVQRGHFGGFGEQPEEELPEKKKSKQEVMNEIIAKSKEHKYERQQQRDMDADLRNELDEDIDDLRALLADTAPAGPARSALPPVRRPANAPTENPEQDSNYDQYVRELAFDARAKPKDRTKTEEEVALEEKEMLEKAEAKRIRRMRGEVSDDEGDDEDGDGERRRKKRKVEKKRGDADDLDDDFEEDDLLGPGIVTREDIEKMALPEQGDVDESDEYDEEGDDDEGEEGSEDDEDDEEDEEEDESDAESLMDDLDEEVASEGEAEEAPALVASSSRSKSKNSKGKAKAEIPYTFPCPSTIEEFEDILESLDDEALPTVIQRIRALHHPSLAQGNKEKLQDFLGVLLDYILILSARSTPALSLINQIQPHLITLVKINHITAATHFTAKLSVMQKNLTRGLSRGAANVSAKTLPGMPELVLLRLLGMIWSTSDYSHPVVMPSVILMGQYLAQSRIRDVRDVGSGLFICSLLAQFEAESKRLLPEAINFLAGSIMALLPRKKDAQTNNAYPDIIAPDVKLHCSSSDATTAQEPVDLPRILNLSPESSTSEIEQGKVDALAVNLRLIQTYAALYASSEAFIDLLDPMLKVLEGSRVARLSPAVKKLHEDTTSTLSRQLSFARAARRPLALQSHKPIPIATHAPKFEDDFAPGKHYDPDVERNANQKIKALYKKERKGAIKELRKDNKFLAGEKSREQSQKDKDYISKMRRVEGEINVERAEEKEMQRTQLHNMVVEHRKAERISNYTQRWEKDSSKDSKAHTQERLDQYQDVVNGYYDGATELYEYGWGESFHFCRFYKGEAFLQAIARHEHYLASQVGLKPGMRVLDVGCGVGGPAREIARFSDANITGITLNDFQVSRATQKTKKAGLSDRVNFVQGDFMKLSEQFGENSFDAVYAIEATVHAPTFEGIYGEIFKVLKPGGKFGVYEWCMTDAWDPSNPQHKEIAHGIEIGDGIAEMRTIHDARKALKSVGFNILHEEDLADRPDVVSWYYPLEGDIRKAQTLWDMLTVFRMTTLGKMITQNSVWCLEKAGFVPKGTYDIGENLKTAATYLVAGGQKKLFTPMMLWVCEKPAN